MALTKIGKEGITGISNASDATAITITSGENVGIGTSSPSRHLTVQNTLANGGGVIGLTSSDSSTSGSLGILHFGNSTDSSQASIGGLSDGSTSAGALLFKTEANGGAIEERMRIHSGGVVSIPNGVELGSALDATAANTLDDYEEGTFTPTFLGAGGNPSVGYGNQLGIYTKIGRMVSIEIRITTTSVSGGSGNLRIGGLPFSQVDGGSQVSGGLYKTFVFDWNTDPETFIIFGDQNYIDVYTNDSGNTSAQVSALKTASGTHNYTTISGFYRAA
tara:strand:- start:87 stop:914 length:828 start_codon:yes stop_codon:yes gene_type:complete